MLTFLREYFKWHKEHKDLVREARLRKDMSKLHLDYNVIAFLMESLKSQNDENFVIEITGKDFRLKMFYDDKGKVVRKTFSDLLTDVQPIEQ